MSSIPRSHAGSGLPSETFVQLRAGARVRRLAKKGDWTQVRFVGAVEVEGWVPEASIGESAPRRDAIGRVPSGRRTLMVIPGAVIRSEPKWAARAPGLTGLPIGILGFGVGAASALVAAAGSEADTSLTIASCYNYGPDIADEANVWVGWMNGKPYVQNMECA